MPINSKLSSLFIMQGKAWLIRKSRLPMRFPFRFAGISVSKKGERIPSSIVLLRLILFLDIDVESLREEVDLCVPVSTFKEDIVSSDVTVYTSFGIRFMQSAGNGWVKLNSVSDVSVDKSFVANLCKLFTDNQLDPIHLTVFWRTVSDSIFQQNL